MAVEPSPFLSICIPTFNNAAGLRRTLQQLTSDSYFRGSRAVEIVVSDNCSTDDTGLVVHEFASLYPDLVRYSRTESNIEDANFERVLRMGSGRFLKLMNDSFSVRPGLLEPWVRILKALSKTRPVVFLVNEAPCEDESSLIFLNGLSEFLAKVSFNCTWIGGFGIWREDLEDIPDLARASKLLLMQVDALLRMISVNPHVVVIRESMLECHTQRRKTGYNIAEVFGANYLALLKPYVERGELSPSAFATEKKRVLLEHILPFVVTPHHDFAVDRLEHHLRDYADEPYFLPALKAALTSLVEQTTASKPASSGSSTPQSEPFEVAWRRMNAHNETIPGNFIELSKVSIGRRTYGTINVWHWGHPDEYLRIGHFCSIGAGVEFYLGGNHSMSGFSTFPFKVKYFGHHHEALSKGPIVVGDDVWIGNRATVHSGVKIGQGAVVAAGAVVTKDVPPYCIVAGNPARVIRERVPQEVAQELLKLDFGSITDESIRTNSGLLYSSLDRLGARTLVNSLMKVDTAPKTVAENVISSVDFDSNVDFQGANEPTVGVGLNNDR